MLTLTLISRMLYGLSMNLYNKKINNMETINLSIAEMIFTNPDDIAEGFRQFLADARPNDIINISHMVTAIQTPAAAFDITGSQQPKVIYQFRFIVVYC